jgi:hypothetical protein
MTEPKTVSNLPLDVSIRWAEDQKLLEETRPIITEATGISLHTQKDVAVPVAFPEIEVLLGIRKTHPTWAMFYLPLGYLEQRRRLFTSQIAPFLGTDEQQDMQIQRIESISDDDEEQKQRKKSLLKLLKLIHDLNRDLVEILSRCRQYQKG